MASTINAKNTSTGVVITPDASGQLELQTADTTRMTIDVNGNVGVGNNNPQFKLSTQQGSALAAPSLQSTPQLYVKGFAGSSLPYAGISFAMYEHTNGYWGSGILSRDDTSSYGAALSFYTSSGSATPSPTERMRIASDGNVQLSTANTSILNSSGRKILNQTGSILQVVTGTTATEVTSSSGTYVDTGLTATITPSSTSSKILVIVQQVGCGKINDVTLQLKLLRNTTDLMWLERSGGWTATATRNYFGTCGCSFLDSPSTTSAVTYKTQMAAFSPAATVYTQFNVGAGNPTSTITLLEIAG